MNRACFSKIGNLHEQNQHASSIRPLKNNFVRMKSDKRLLVVLTSLVSGKLSAFKIAQNKVRKTPKNLLKKVDVFAEPLSEIIDEFIDIIAVSFDEVKEAVFGSNEQNKAKTVETGMKVKTTPGRYARVKV